MTKKKVWKKNNSASIWSSTNSHNAAGGFVYHSTLKKKTLLGKTFRENVLIYHMYFSRYIDSSPRSSSSKIHTLALEQGMYKNDHSSENFE